MRIPQTVGVGSAKIVLSFEAWKEGHVATLECQLPVVAAPPGQKREAVSSRLRQALVHPDKSGILVGLYYSADGRRLFAGHPYSGVVQVWDAVSGRQMTSIETGQRAASLSDYFQVSPDGRFLYVDRSTTRLRSFMEKEKRLYHWDFSGGVRSWDVATGKPCHDFQPAADRGITSMQLSPDGSTLLTFEGLSGDYESTSAKWFATLWDARTGQRRATLPKNISARAAFAPDSKTLRANAINDKGEMTALLFLDAATGEVRRSIPVERPYRRVSLRSFSPDGKVVAFVVIEIATKTFWLKCLDVESGREIASFEGEKNNGFGQPVFSPDGQRLAACHSFQTPKLYLIEVAKRKLLKHIPVGVGRIWRDATFSPDGRWLAVISQESSVNQSPLRLNPEDLPQPRILLIESATGEVRETLIAPAGVAVSLCFSPDGKTLASGGDGRVLLWDMTKPPGTQAPKKKE
jgi:WD40 repeat protein